MRDEKFRTQNDKVYEWRGRVRVYAPCVPLWNWIRAKEGKKNTNIRNCCAWFSFRLENATQPHGKIVKTISVASHSAATHIHIKCGIDINAPVKTVYNTFGVPFPLSLKSTFHKCMYVVRVMHTVFVLQYAYSTQCEKKAEMWLQKFIISTGNYYTRLTASACLFACKMANGYDFWNARNGIRR